MQENSTDNNILQTVVSFIWFIYDFSTYSFSIYSSAWIDIILGDSSVVWKSFAWSTLSNFFYIPGSFLGGFVSDWVGPRGALLIGLIAQGIIGFIMAGCYEFLATSKNVAAFVVVYG